MKQRPLPPKNAHTSCMYVARIHFCEKSHNFHYLLKFVKRLQITPLLTLPTQSHPHPQTEPLLIPQPLQT